MSKKERFLVVCDNDFFDVYSQSSRWQPKRSKTKSPGMLKKHYSPGIPVLLGKKPKNLGDAYIIYGKKNPKRPNYFNLSQKADLKEAAANLYKTMRIIKKKGFKRIFVSKIPNKGAGIAINDRLKKASS